jgi:hypothetical protein
MEPFATSFPRNSHFFNLDTHPSHFLLEAKVFDNVDRVVACLDRQQYKWLFGDGKLDFFGCYGNFNINMLLHIFVKIDTVSPYQVMLIVIYL